MQRASPTMITPVRYAGWSARNSQASANMNAGPITHERKSDIAEEATVVDAVRARLAEILVSHLRQNGVHHQQEADRDRQADRAHAQRVQSVVDAGDERSEGQPARHCQRDPQGEEPIERREPSDNRRFA